MPRMAEQGPSLLKGLCLSLHCAIDGRADQASELAGDRTQEPAGDQTQGLAGIRPKN